MKQILKKFSSVLITLCMVLTLFPTIAFADYTVSDTVSEIEATGLTATLSDGGKTVTVDGTAELSDRLLLHIPEDVTVLWKATVKPADGMGKTLINLSSSGTGKGGTFEVADGANLSTDSNAVISSQDCSIVVSGGIVSCDSDSMAAFSAIYTAKSITVNGGTVQNTGRGYAIRVAGSDMSITVNGGTVENTHYGDAIFCPGGSGFENVDIAVSGGTVRAVSGYAISMSVGNDDTSSVVVSGGEIKAIGTGNAISNYGCPITVSGGTVSATTGYAIWDRSTTPDVTVSGGTVFAYASDISGEGNMIYLKNATDGFTAPTGDGVVIAWDQGKGNTRYSSDSSEDLTVSPEGAAKWSNEGANSGISYGNGSNTGFILVEGVTVKKEVSTADAFKSALESTTNPTITVIGNIEMTSDITVGASHTLYIDNGSTLSTGEGSTLTIPSGKTLTLTGMGTFKVNNSTVEKGVDVQGTLESNSTNIIVANKFSMSGGTNGIILDSSAQMLIHGGSLEVSSSCYNGISGNGMLSVDGNCQVMVKNTPGPAGGATTGINTNLTIKNSTVQVQDMSDSGLTFSDGMQLTMEDAVIDVASNGDLAFFNLQITSDTNSKIIFAEGATLYIVNQIFSDRGNVTKTGYITVGAEDSVPSTKGLTAGKYVWNGSVFAKGNVVTAVTLNKTALSLYSNTSTKTANLTATIAPTDATDKSVTWQSSNVSVATVDANGLVTAVGNGTAIITVKTTDGGYTASCTVTVSTYSSGGGTSSGGSSGGGSSSGGGAAITTPTTIVSGSTATTETKAETNSDGKATASVTQSQMNNAIDMAQKAAEEKGEAPKVEIEVSGASTAKEVKTTLANASVQKLATEKMGSLAISSAVVEMTFDGKALDKIASQTSGDVSFGVSKVDNDSLSEEAKGIVGDRPVYDFTVTSGDKKITEFDGTVTVSIPYTLAAGENPNAIVAYYINADGKPEIIQNCRYDAKHGVLIFTTTHFSIYAVGYQKVAFDDVKDSAWYADAVTFLAARNITGGTTKTTYGPNETLTRGQFITLLMRAYNIQPDDDSNDNFSDAGDTYYTDYLAAAKRLGITGGVGDNKFDPKQAVTRQQMFTLLYNALKVIDQLTEGDSEKALTDFTDSDHISSYAKEAMGYFVEIGTVSGTNGKLLPEATTSRGEMAQVLYNLLSE